jgi:hypothetical protein
MAKLGWFVSELVVKIASTAEFVDVYDGDLPGSLWAAQSDLPSTEGIMSEEKMSPRPVILCVTMRLSMSIADMVAERM